MKTLWAKVRLHLEMVDSCGQIPTFECKNLNPNLPIQRTREQVGAYLYTKCVLSVFKFTQLSFCFLLAFSGFRKTLNILPHWIPITTLQCYHLHLIDKDRELYEAQL